MAAIRPGLSTTAGLLALISSPYAKRGELFTLYDKHYAAHGDPLVLVAQGSSLDFNPTLSPSIIDRAIERDATAAAAEYLGLFRSDIQSLFDRDAVLAVVPDGLFEREREPDLRYHGFVDPSGGSSDSFTIAISHRNADQIFLDAVREVRPPFNPQQVVCEFAALCKRFKVSRVTGDRYAGLWPRVEFLKYGITYRVAEQSKSELFLNFLPLLNSRTVELLDHPRLIAQLIGLERRTARSGKDSIDHQPGQHDDISNAVAGSCLLASVHGGRDLRMFTANLPYAIPEHDDRPVELDPRTLKPIEREHVSALSAANNGCHVGPGIASPTSLELLAIEFNHAHKIRRPR